MTAPNAASNTGIRPHHQAPAAMWGQGGRHYDDISFAISDALAHGAQRLGARPGEQALDVGTGTGWSARNVARSGACVTAVDISEAMLEAARTLSAHVRPPISFELADVEQMPFQDARFDRLISTFGVMFALDQRQAAAELARVCKRGARLVLVCWAPGGAVEEFFGVLAKHDPEPAPASAASPMAWGDPKAVEDLLGHDFELAFEHGLSEAYHDSVDDIWDWYARGFGPVRSLVTNLEGDAAAALRADVDDYHRHYANASGRLHVKREYLLTLGHRCGLDTSPGQPMARTS